MATLNANGIECKVVLHREGEYLDQIKSQEMEDLNMSYEFVDNYSDALAIYDSANPDWIIFGNVPKIEISNKDKLSSKFALMEHGIGPKATYYNVSKYPFDVRFVEGQFRLERLQDLFPDSHFIDTGYAKLDPIFSSDAEDVTMQQFGLSSSKKTILYAPTFFPSSIERFTEKLPQQLENYNLLIKPHFFSYVKDKYASHRQLFEEWRKYENVYVADVNEYNLIPFMKVSDIMLSDTSSAMFEFAALDKPLIWCNFLETRWSYRGIFKFRLNKRLDPDLEIFNEFTRQADSPKNIHKLVKEELDNYDRLSEQRKRITESMVGATDGKCSQRICDFFIQNLNL